jgi:hypothetical protein
MSFQQEFQRDLLRGLLLQAQPAPLPTIERRVYYDEQGHVLTYTCEDLPGNYIVVTAEQFSEARPDAIVRDGQLVYTHKLSHVSRLAPAASGTPTSRHDVNILVDSDDPDAVFWAVQLREVSSD